MDPAIRTGMGRILIWLEMAAAFICLIMMSQALTVLFDPGVLADDQPLLRMLWYPVYLFTLAALAVRPGPAFRLALINVLALAPVALAVLSTLWSIDPGITFRRTIALAGTTAFALYLALRFNWRDLLTMIGVLFLVLAIASLLTALLLPSRGVMWEIHPGAWSGLWSEKNEFGAQMTRGVLIFSALLVLYAEKRRTLWVWGGLLLSCALVLMSTSKTSLLGSLMVPAAIIAILALRRGAVPGLVLACAAALGAVLLASVMIWDLDLVFEMLGRERSLTGRTDIWEALARAIAERPLLGYGYGVFWRDEWGPAWWVRQATQWAVPTAHNGWLETALSTGLAGVALAALYVMATAVMGVARIPRLPETLFALPYIALTLVFSLSESIILQHNNLSWVLFVTVAAKLFAGDSAAVPAPGSTPANDRRPVPPRPRRHAPNAPTASCAPVNSVKPCVAGRLRQTVSKPLTLFRVSLRPGAPMIDLSADLAGLAAGLDRTRPADGRGRVIMFTSPRVGLGVSLLSREFARMMARRAPRGVWLFDLDLSRNEHFAAFTNAEARQRYGPIGPALDTTLGVEPFWRVTSGRPEDEGRSTNISALLTLHRVGGTRMFVSRFHPELLGRGQKVHIRAAHSYWERLRDTVELAVIDAPATERSFAGRPLYGEADAVVIVVDDNPETMREAEMLAETVRDRGGLPAGVIVNMVPEDATGVRRAG